jgi:AmmeMemoRadiSam system protein B
MLAEASTVAPKGEIIGLVAPHAGHRYSGAIAAQAFKLVQGESFERVVVISPMHHFYDAPILTSSHEAYQTPLGLIPVERATLDALWQRIPVASVRRDPEHALEIELPFLQRALKEPFSLVPLMLRDQTYAVAEALGTALAAVLGTSQGTLLIASSDLSHFYTDQEARELDQTMLQQVAAFDPLGVIRIEDEGRGFACGRAAIATILVTARELGADCAQIVGYGTSGDTTGDRSRVVGYGAAVIYRSQGESKPT